MKTEETIEQQEGGELTPETAIQTENAATSQFKLGRWATLCAGIMAALTAVGCKESSSGSADSAPKPERQQSRMVTQERGRSGAVAQERVKREQIETQEYSGYGIRLRGTVVRNPDGTKEVTHRENLDTGSGRREEIPGTERIENGKRVREVWEYYYGNGVRLKGRKVVDDAGRTIRILERQSF